MMKSNDKELAKSMLKEADYLERLAKSAYETKASSGVTAALLLRKAAKEIELLKSIGEDLAKSNELLYLGSKPEEVFYKNQFVIAGGQPYFYSHYEVGLHHLFSEGRTEAVAKATGLRYDSYANNAVKPDPDAKSLFAWIMNDGVVTDYDGDIVCELRNGDHVAKHTKKIISVSWRLQDYPTDIIRYFKL